MESLQCSRTRFVCRHCGNNSHAIEGSTREKEKLCAKCFDYQCHSCGGESKIRLSNKTRHLNLCKDCETGENMEKFCKIVTNPERYAAFLENEAYHARTYKNYRKGL